MPNVLDKIADALHIPRQHKAEEGGAAAHAEPSTSAAEQPKRTPVFDSSKVTVLFVLGGPGAGEHPPSHDTAAASH